MVHNLKNTEHIYDAAHAISIDVMRRYEPQRHIFFTSSPVEVMQYNMRGDEIRIYSNGNFKKVRGLLRKMDEKEWQRSKIHCDMGNPLSDVKKFVIDRAKASWVDPNDSWVYTPSKEQFMNIAKRASPYFSGLSRVDLYASVFGNKRDIDSTRIALNKRFKVVDERLKRNQKDIDDLYVELMDVKTKNPKKEEDSNEGFLSRLFSLFRNPQTA